MFWIVLGLVIVVLVTLSVYYAIKSLCAECSTIEGNRFAFFWSDPWFSLGTIIIRIACQVNIAKAIFLYFSEDAKMPIWRFVIQILLAFFFAAMEGIECVKHLEMTEDTTHVVEGKYDIDIDEKEGTIKVSRHIEGSPPSPRGAILSFPFRLVHSFFLPIGRVILEWILYKKYVEKKIKERKRRSEE